MFVLLLSLLSLTLAEDPKPCCTMEKYTAVLKLVSGSMTVGNTKGLLSDDLIELHYDFNRSKIVSVSHLLDQNTGVRKDTTLIYDFRNSRQYVLPETGVCFTQQLDPNAFPSPCMAQNLTYSGSYEIGSASKRIRTNSFAGQFGPYRASIALTDNECTPVAYSQYGNNGKSEIFQAFLFTNITKDWVDDSLFTIPSECSYPFGVIGKRDAETVHFQQTPFYVFSHQCMMFN